jgi:hypothetical protein
MTRASGKDMHAMTQATRNGEPDPEGGAAQSLGLMRQVNEGTARPCVCGPARGCGQCPGAGVMRSVVMCCWNGTGPNVSGWTRNHRRSLLLARQIDEWRRLATWSRKMIRDLGFVSELASPPVWRLAVLPGGRPLLNRQGLPRLVARRKELTPAPHDVLVGSALGDIRGKSQQQVQMIIHHVKPADADCEDFREFLDPIFDPLGWPGLQQAGTRVGRTGSCSDTSGPQLDQ